MKIAHSTISLQSQHALYSSRSQHLSVRAWGGSRATQDTSPRAGSGVVTTLSGGAQTAGAAASAKVDGSNDAVRNDPRLSMLIQMVEAITGRAVQVFNVQDLQANRQSAVPEGMPAEAPAAPPGADASQLGGAGFAVEVQSVETEGEVTMVSAQGMLQTADGKQVSFHLDLAMQRSFEQQTTLTLQGGEPQRPMKDPLVINFDGAGVELADTQFAFDIDADGQTENIAFVSGGSGFLAFDRNADGRINDGTELFGATSGNGFIDLALYDQDGNQWIDEGDAIFSKLQVWRRDGNGNDALVGLSQSGVGALYLGHVASPFSVRTAANQTLGQVRSSGVFLYESGQVGSLQQVDL